MNLINKLFHFNKVYSSLLLIAFFSFLFSSCKKSSDNPLPNQPVVTKINPGEALAGSKLLLSGSKFTGATQVLINNIKADFILKADTSIEVTVPISQPMGETKVQVVATKDTSAPQLFYVIIAGPKPEISSLLPSKNVPTQQIMLYGKNLMGVSKIMMGSTNVTIDDKTDIAITMKVPKVSVGIYQLNVFANTGSSNKTGFEVVSSMPAGGFSSPPSIIIASPPPPGFIPGATNTWQAPDQYPNSIFPRLDLTDPTQINIFTTDADCTQNRTLGFSTNCSYYTAPNIHDDFALSGDGIVNMNLMNGTFNNYVELILHFPAKYGGDEKFVGRFDNSVGNDCNYKNSEMILISTRTGRQWRIK